jgi:hypothetical protein
MPNCSNGHTPECVAKSEQIRRDLRIEESIKIAKSCGEQMVPMAVIKAIINAWPDQAVEIIGELRFSGDHYGFIRWGMYVGVEYDGYIHT